MHVKDRLTSRLQIGRRFSEGLLKSIQKPEEWTYRVHPTANHALWIIGHISHVDNAVLKMLCPAEAVDNKAWESLFGPESDPQNDPQAYPSPQELLAYFRDRREKVLNLLAGQTDETLGQPVPAGSPPMFSDIASVFEILSFHEAMHMGQLTVARQALKHPRLVKFPRLQ